MPYRIFYLLFVCLLSVTVVQAQPPPNLVVAWVDKGDVWVWRASDDTAIQYTNGSALNTFISPDGQYTAFTTNPSSGLWLISPNNATPVQVVPREALTENTGESVGIGDAQWGRNHTLYFDTQIESLNGARRKNDLWVLDAAAQTYQKVLPTSQGGFFQISPDGNSIALAQPGVYDGTLAAIRIVELATLKALNHLDFPAVSSGASYDFYPNMSWMADGQQLNVGIPDKDLVYADDTALTILWQLGVGGSQKQLGTIQASIFGQPKWSDDGAYLAYMKHQGDITTNGFDLITAAGDGSKPEVYASGTAGTLNILRWLANSHTLQYVSATSEAAHFWIGEPTKAPTALANGIWSLKFIDHNTYIFAGYGASENEPFGLYAARLDDPTQTFIAPTGDYPYYAAVLIP